PAGERLAEWKGIAGEDCSVQWSPDGRQLAVSGWGRVTLIAAEQGSQPQIIMAPEEVLAPYPKANRIQDRPRIQHSGSEPGGIIFASISAISAELRTVASVAPDASIGIWDLATRKIIQKLPAPARGAITDCQSAGLRSLAFSPDGRRLACTALEGHVVFWQVPAAPAKPAVQPETGPAGLPPGGSGAQGVYPPLEFRVAANRADSDREPRVPADFEKRHYPDNSAIGRMMARDRGFVWIKVVNPRDGKIVLPLEGVRGAELRVALVADTPDHALPWNLKWFVEECRTVAAPDGRGHFD